MDLKAFKMLRIKLSHETIFVTSSVIGSINTTISLSTNWQVALENILLKKVLGDHYCDSRQKESSDFLH